MTEILILMAGLVAGAFGREFVSLLRRPRLHELPPATSRQLRRARRAARNALPLPQLHEPGTRWPQANDDFEPEDTL